MEFFAFSEQIYENYTCAKVTKYFICLVTQSEWLFELTFNTLHIQESCQSQNVEEGFSK